MHSCSNSGLFILAAIWFPKDEEIMPRARPLVGTMVTAKPSLRPLIAAVMSSGWDEGRLAVTEESMSGESSGSKEKRTVNWAA